jgi:hypothetical protein
MKLQTVKIPWLMTKCRTEVEKNNINILYLGHEKINFESTEPYTDNFLLVSKKP